MTRSSRRLRVLVVSGLCGVLLGACGAKDEPATSSIQTPSASSEAEPSLAAPQENDEDLQTLGPLGELTDADLAAAHGRAVDFLRAFAATSQDASAWWAGIQPLLSPSAAEDYSFVDPAEVPTFEVQPTSVQDLPGGSPALLQVQVGTSRGDYVVTLTRTSVTDPWLISRCDPPDDAQ